MPGMAPRGQNEREVQQWLEKHGPDGKLVTRWDALTSLALVFTAIVTPYEAALLETLIRKCEAQPGVDADATYLRGLIGHRPLTNQKPPLI